MKLSSSEFEEGGPIPVKCGYKKENTCPQLEISGVPAGAKSLAIIMDDPDAMAAVGRVWVHWLAWNIRPDTASISESGSPPGCLQGKTDFGKMQYGGPAPPDKRHTYVFEIYALDSMLELAAGADKKALLGAMDGKVMGKARLTGTYEPQQ